MPQWETGGVFFMRYVIDHWPEFLFTALVIIGGVMPVFLPGNPWMRIALIPVGWALGVAAWAGIVFFACWAFPPKSSGPTSTP
jgi:hypothetical protein